MPTIEHIINQSFLNPHFDYIPFLSVKTYYKTTFYIPIVTKKHLNMSPPKKRGIVLLKTNLLAHFVTFKHTLSTLQLNGHMLDSTHHPSCFLTFN